MLTIDLRFRPLFRPRSQWSIPE